jgi:hypothetical protein
MTDFASGGAKTAKARQEGFLELPRRRIFDLVPFALDQVYI